MSRFAFVFAALVAIVPLAQADVAPPDQCNTAGAACNNAGTSYNEAGTCVATTCSRATPSGPMEYACNRCELASALDMAMGTTPKKDNGCAVGGEAAGLSALFAVGAALLARRRRGQ